MYELRSAPLKLGAIFYSCCRRGDPQLSNGRPTIRLKHNEEYQARTSTTSMPDRGNASTIQLIQGVHDDSRLVKHLTGTSGRIGPLDASP